jgi:hypothetical protein
METHARMVLVIWALVIAAGAVVVMVMVWP